MPQDRPNKFANAHQRKVELLLAADVSSLESSAVTITSAVTNTAATATGATSAAASITIVFVKGIGGVLQPAVFDKDRSHALDEGAEQDPRGCGPFVVK